MRPRPAADLKSNSFWGRVLILDPLLMSLLARERSIGASSKRQPKLGPRAGRKRCALRHLHDTMRPEPIGRQLGQCAPTRPKPQPPKAPLTSEHTRAPLAPPQPNHAIHSPRALPWATARTCSSRCDQSTAVTVYVTVGRWRGPSAVIAEDLIQAMPAISVSGD